MRLRRLVFLTSTLLLLCAFAAGQTRSSESADDKAKKKKAMDEMVVQMLDGAINDAGGLRLPGNRAVIDAMTADVYWKFDEKRARELFHNAANELVTFNAEAEKEAAESTDPNFLVSFGPNDPTDPRTDVLNFVAKHDVDLALELLLQTRSAQLADAMAKAAAAGGAYDFTSPTNTMDNVRAMQEAQLEESFAQRSAMNDPDKIVKLIKDSMTKGVTTGLIQMLQNLNQKDAKKAADLGSDVIAKLSDADMVKNQNDMRTALSYLQYAARPVAPPGSPGAAYKTFAFADAQMKGLAGKMVDALLVPSKSMMAMTMITQAIPTLEKFVPERVPALKARDAENKKSLPTEMRASVTQSSLWNQSTTPEERLASCFDSRGWTQSTTPEEILAQLPKMTNENDKRNAYSQLANKIGQIPDEARAKKLIDQIPDDKTRASAQEQFDTARAGRAVSAGKIDEARRLIGQMTNRRQQIPLLIGLATQTQRKGTEKDIATAKELMLDAKRLVKDFPDDEDDMADLMTVVRGYGAVDTDAAFRLFEPLVEEFNSTIQAAAILSKYNKRDRTFKHGELVLRAGNGGFNPANVMLFRYTQQLQALGKADFERMSQIADRFTRSDVRTIVRLFVLQGYMTPDPKPAPPPPPAGIPGLGSGTVRP